MTFPSANLVDVCEIVIGRTPSRNDRSYWGEGYPWLSISDLGEQEVWKTREEITSKAVADCRCRLVEPGTVMLSFKLSIGKVGIARVPLFTNEAVAALPIRKGSNLDTKFLYWALRSIDLTEGLDRAAKGLTLNKDKLERIPIPLPGLEDQVRIAAILDKADSLRSKRREALAKLDHLAQSIFVEMFGDLVKGGWPVMSVEDVAADANGAIRTGPFGSQLLHSEFVDAGIAVLGIDNAVANEFRWGERRFITEAKYQTLLRYTVKPGDVLITIMGTCGRCAVVPDDIPPAINTKHLCCITLDRSKCLPTFLHSYFLWHPTAQQYLAQTSKGAIMDGLNMGIVKAMPIVTPPTSLQEEFAARLDAIKDCKSAHVSAMAQAEALFTSIQHRAFRGEL